MSRGIALENVVILILAVFLLSILLLLFFSYTSFTYAPIVLFDRISMMVRGNLIDILITVMFDLIVIFLAFIWSSPEAFATPANLIKNGIESAIVSAVIAATLTSLLSQIPFFFIGPISITADQNSMVKNMPSYLSDAAAMLNFGNKAPTYGEEDPVQCFIITLKPGDYNVSKWFLNLKDRLYSTVPLKSSTKLMVPSKSGKDYVEFRFMKKVFHVYIYEKEIHVYLITPSKSGFSETECLDEPIDDIHTYKLSCNGYLNNGYRIHWEKVVGKKNEWKVTLGFFVTLGEELKNKVVYLSIKNGGEWAVYNLFNSNDLNNLKDVDLYVSKNNPRVVYIEFYDDYQYYGGLTKSSFYAPECGGKSVLKNKIHEGIYVCIP